MGVAKEERTDRHHQTRRASRCIPVAGRPRLPATLLAGTSTLALLMTTTPGRAAHVIDGGAVFVDGSGGGTEPSPWSVPNDLIVGNSNSGTLVIRNGGSVSSGAGTHLGEASSGDGTVTVTGAGSSWTNTRSIRIGNNGQGTLTISDGASVSNQSAFLGYGGNGTGTATVTGAGSTWTNSGSISIGSLGSNNQLTVSNGGKVSASMGVIGFLSGSGNAALVTGQGSTWSMAGELQIGVIGSGTMTVDMGGKVTASDVSLGDSSGNGTINLQGTTGARGVLETGQVFEGGGHGHLSFDGGILRLTGDQADLFQGLDSGNITIGAAGAFLDTQGFTVESAYEFSGPHELTKLGAGTLTLTGDSSGFAGTTRAAEGRLVVGTGGGGALGGTLDVLGGATLAGSGTVGDTDVATGATIAPGNSIGTLNVDGRLTLSPGATLAYELGRPGTAADPSQGQSDRIDVTGDLTLDGTLDLTQSGAPGDGDVAVGYYRLMTYGGTLTDNGLTVGTAPTDPAIGTYRVEAGGGTVDLYAAPTGDDTLQHWQGGDGVWASAATIWVNRNGVAPVAWAGHHAAFKDANGFTGGTVTVQGTQDFQGLQFIDEGYVLTGGGALRTDPGGSEIRVLADRAVIATPITGTGDMTKTGAGTLELTGDSSAYNGTTTVAAGRLTVNGSLGGTLMVTGGHLDGSGTLGNLTVAANTTVAPGNSIGTMTVNGDITFSKNAVYAVEVEPTGQTSDLIAATGQAILNGGTVRHVGKSGAYRPSATYTILTADGGVVGTFDSVTSDLAFLDASLGYDTKAVTLTLARNDTAFDAVARTPNQRATAGAVEPLAAGHPVHDAVVQLDGNEARAAFDQLSGEIHASLTGALAENSRVLRRAIGTRLRAAGDTMTTDTMPMAVQGIGGQEAADASPSAATTWGQVYGTWSRRNGDGNAATANHTTGGVLFGADSRITDHWRLGLAAGYGRTTLDVDGRASSAEIDTYTLVAYGGAASGPVSLDLGVARGWHGVETRRAVAFQGFSDAAETAYDIRTTQIFAEGRYHLDTAFGHVSPYAGLAHLRLDTDGYTETGSAGLRASHQSADVTYATLGLRASASVEFNGRHLSPHGMLGWQHAFGETTPHRTQAFATGSRAFTVAGTPLAENAALVEAGLDLDLSEATTVGVSYNGRLGRNVRDHGLEARLSMTF